MAFRDTIDMNLDLDTEFDDVEELSFDAEFDEETADCDFDDDIDLGDDE